ncbi:alpha-1,3/1,6-mannosyltransferase ALG2-like [Varroa destructor]|uniref:Alpha-1,3/1,6-mannosyltransferase ALG2 n=1 Tax=Varroa destructor TaxID=109461 RepID=A0A7M7JXM6_VARDE|nr:alpha-1,3/1,6-mannosyltransferase ALG2-like [Varroa destructor]
MRVTFVHLDLGIGGAERLVVDAGLALKKAGHQIEFITSHHDQAHCFPETRGELHVTVCGDWLPRSILGKFYVICSIIRMIYLALYIRLARCQSALKPDLIFVDQVSHCIPWLKLMRVPILFYCHHPDCVLVQKKNTLRDVYRWPINWFEEYSTSLADLIVVNSRYTEKVFRKTFRRLAKTQLEVLYPTVGLALYDAPMQGDLNDIALTKNSDTTFLSLNRFERKKEISLAIKALAYVISCGESDVHLVIAGGYDEALPENVEHFEELQQLAEELHVADRITFLRSPSDAQKQLLLYHCCGVLYTPQNEHFGIVPLEAMYMRRPVIATNTGGPLETIKDDSTGFLCESTPQAFGDAMLKLCRDRNLVAELGEEGRRRVIALFSFNSFQQRLEKIIDKLVPPQENAGK